MRAERSTSSSMDADHGRPQPARALPEGERQTQAKTEDRPTHHLVLADRSTLGRSLFFLQRTAGNQAIARVLKQMPTLQCQSEGTHAPPTPLTAAPAPGQGAEGTAPTAAQDKAKEEAEKEAQNTQDLIKKSLKEALDGSLTERNTAELINSGLVECVPITLRSDNKEIQKVLPSEDGKLYFFEGLTQKPFDSKNKTLPDGTQELYPSTGGGRPPGENKILVRGRKPGGKERKTKDIIRTLVHEVSHFLVESYGFSKIIKNETSEKEQVETERLFERYRSEFRAYWVSGLEYEFPAEDKREAIKVRLVGTGAKDQGAYPNLRDAYWIKRSSFRALVDSYGYGGVNKTKPEGFNLTNSPRLDDLFHKLEKAATRTVSTGEVKDAIKKLKLDERTEARKSELIRDKINALANAEEIRAELSR